MSKEQNHKSAAERTAKAREAMAKKKAEAAAAALEAEQVVEEEKPIEITERDIIEAAIKSKDFNAVEEIPTPPEEIEIHVEEITPEVVEPQIISPSKGVEIIPGAKGKKWFAKVGKKVVRGTEEKVKYFLKNNGVEIL